MVAAVIAEYDLNHLQSFCCYSLINICMIDPNHISANTDITSIIALSIPSADCLNDFIV